MLFEAGSQVSFTCTFWVEITGFGRGSESVAGAGPFEVGVEVGGAGGGRLEFAGHDGRRARAFEVVDETKVRSGGRGLGERKTAVLGSGVVTV